MTVKHWAIGLGALIMTVSAAVAQQTAPAAAPPVAKSEPGPAAAPPPAAKQDAAPQAGGGGRGPFAACRADLNTLCKDAPSGLAGRLQCLKANQSQLSPECKGAIAAILGSVQAKVATMENAPRPIKACQQDIAALCPDLSAGEGGRMKCLRDNAPKLSPACAESLKAARTQSRNALQACEADRTRLCATAGVKAGDQLRCLQERAAELSAQCRQLVAEVRAVKSKAGGKAETPAAGASQPPAALPPPAPPAALAPQAPPKG